MQDTPSLLIAVILAAVGLFVLVVGVFALLVVRPWFRAALCGAPVPLPVVMMMRLRGNPPDVLLDAYIALKQSGRPETIADVEKTYMANKNRVAAAEELVELLRRRKSG